MRIHTNATESQVWAAVRTVQGVGVHSLAVQGSRTHPRSIELRLEGSGGWTNTGRYGAGDERGATWDEWGAVLGAIFDADPSARMGGSARVPVYADADDFHWQTDGRFRDGMPADTHPRHRWQHEGFSVQDAYSVSRCAKCSAVKRTVYRRELVSA